ncbi:hypothetical protein FACS1894151_01320 [Spirochaetia bacterium]|nr:hypothetical protein FACS1894151_01320 [Spirochaetia bacterium]
MKLNTIKGFVQGFIAAVIAAGITGCNVLPESADGGTGKSAGTLTIATWNLQALFDGTENGTEYSDYSIGAGWSAEKYQARLTAVSRAAEQMNAGLSNISQEAPDILALEEVENTDVLMTLAKEGLAKHGYNWTFFANNHGASLGIGVLSKFPLVQTRAHSVTSDGETTPRPILEIQIEPDGSPLVLFICHWKSKLGGDAATEPLRRASARILLRRLRELNDEQPGTPVVIMGDLNENHDEFYRNSGTAISALMPDDPKAAELSGFSAFASNSASDSSLQQDKKAQTDYLVLSREKPPRSTHYAAQALVFYSPWGSELQQGSYYYQNNWETIDHFLMNEALFDEAGWNFETCAVVNTAPFATQNSRPYAYNPRTGSGLSDHFPLLLVLKLK